MEKNTRWENDTMILISKKARQRLKMLALKKGQTVKEYLEEISYDDYGDVKRRSDRIPK